MNNNPSNPDKSNQLEWLFEKRLPSKGQEDDSYEPHYGDVTELNTNRLILDSVGKDTLRQIAEDAIDLLETSVAIYETNGDYAYGMFSSGWCQLMDTASRKLCHTDDNRIALDCGCWLCHENCWNDSAKAAIESGQSTDIQCVGGINLYAEPIYAGETIVGTINIGYGTPPTDLNRLKELADLFEVDLQKLKEQANSYNPRPQFLGDLAKKRLQTSANFIGEIVEKSILQKSLVRSEERLRSIIHRSPFPIAVADTADEKISYWSQSAIDKFGHTPENVSEWYALAYPDPDYRKNVIKLWKPFLKKASESKEAVNTGEYQIVCKDGTIKTCELYAQIIPGNLIVTFNDITERKQAEKSLRVSEDDLKKSQKIAHVGSWRLDIASNQVVWSDELYKMYGFDPLFPPPPYTEHQKLFTRVSWEKLSTALQNTIDMGIPYELELETVREDGSNGWMWVRGETVLDEKSIIVGLYGAAQDITERKQAEDILKKSETRFRAIFEQAPLGIALVDTVTEDFYEVNQKFSDIIGLTKEEAVNTHWTRITHPDDIKQDQDNMDRLRNGEIPGFNMQKRYRHKNNTYVWINMTIAPVEVEDKTHPRHLCMIEDITSTKQAEERLKKQEYYLKKTQEIGLLGAWENDLVKDTLIWTDQVYRIFGIPLGKEVTFNDFFAMVHPDDSDYVNREWTLALKGKPWEVNHRIIVAGEIKWIREKAILDFDDDGNCIHVVGFAQDITERKLAEKEKLKAQKIAGEQKKLALVGQVAGKMAHDFNNILGIIMGNTELTLLDCQEPETRKTLELIFEQTIRGKNLTKNLVAFAKDQEPKQEFFRINEKIDLVLNLMRKDLEGIELRKEESQGVPELLADPGMIEHALVNLIQNSIHATSMNEFPRIIVRTYSLDNKICFEIEDNGCGISKENLENIYEPSFTLKGSKDVTGSYKSGIKGTGYGMANIKKYVEQHKGIISVESELGSGTKFTICLPVIKKELTQEEKVELREEIIHFEKYILLVEDEVDIANVQYKMLTEEPCNHKVDKADNGQVAMDLFDRNNYDFVSLDYVLPGGINGLDVYHHIRKTNQTVPVLFISGNIEFLESIKKLKQKDAYIDHLSKPCQNKDYVNGINELLEKKH